MQAWSGCDAAGSRLQEGDDFPYFETSGFPARFVKRENSLCARDADRGIARDAMGNAVLECMCGNVLCGRTDPVQPFFTERGSFWTNGTTRLLVSTTEADRQARTRVRCNGEGYESVALVPLRGRGHLRPAAAGRPPRRSLLLGAHRAARAAVRERGHRPGQASGSESVGGQRGTVTAGAGGLQAGHLRDGPADGEGNGQRRVCERDGVRAGRAARDRLASVRAPGRPAGRRPHARRGDGRPLRRDQRRIQVVGQVRRVEMDRITWAGRRA